MTLRFGIHAGVWGFDWSPAAAESTIRAAAEIGYDLVEIPAIDRNALRAEDTRRSLERHGMEASVSLALGFTEDISDEDAAIAARGERRLNEAVMFASEIGSSYVGGVTYSAMGRYLSTPSEQRRENSLRVLRRVAARARALNVTLGIEYVNRYESNLLNTARQTVGFIEDIDADNVVLHLDTFHAASEEQSLAHAVQDAGAHLGYIHASESHRGALGTGSTDWSALGRALEEISYAGPITVETFSSAVVADSDAVDIALWRPQWSDPSAVAAQSLAVLRAGILRAAQPHPA